MTPKALNFSDVRDTNSLIVSLSRTNLPIEVCEVKLVGNFWHSLTLLVKQLDGYGSLIAWGREYDGTAFDANYCREDVMLKMPNCKLKDLAYLDSGAVATILVNQVEIINLDNLHEDTSR